MTGTSESSRPFPCTGCGLCCRNVAHSPLTVWLDRSDGVCRHYEEQTQSCAIYGNRPDVCRVGQGHARFFSNVDFKEYLKLNAQICNMLQTQQGLPASYRVIL